MRSRVAPASTGPAVNDIYYYDDEVFSSLREAFNYIRKQFAQTVALIELEVPADASYTSTAVEYKIIKTIDINWYLKKAPKENPRIWSTRLLAREHSRGKGNAPSVWFAGDLA